MTVDRPESQGRGYATGEVGGSTGPWRGGLPQVYNIKEDPAEQFELWGNEGFSHAWVMTPVTGILNNLATSMVEFPNIKPGEEFEGYE
ncbi:hypothetical protein [Ruegeria sp. A3M17]|uniref:hypothetical protein n=1 Tax=Ruegeria sp. A3M17 TaxID=2267229 RepID=UPI001313F19C|nr:hypothetical protein [Ruegeria sp. A3M17]